MKQTIYSLIDQARERSRKENFVAVMFNHNTRKAYITNDASEPLDFRNSTIVIFENGVTTFRSDQDFIYYVAERLQ